MESVIFPASVEEIDETAFMYNFDNLKFETQEKIKSIWLDMVQKRKQEFKMLNQFLDSCDKKIIVDILKDNIKSIKKVYIAKNFNDKEIIKFIQVLSYAILHRLAGQIVDLESYRPVGDGECYGLLGKILDIVSELGARDANIAIATLQVVDFNGGYDTHLVVCGGEHKPAPLDREQEVGKSRY